MFPSSRYNIPAPRNGTMIANTPIALRPIQQMDIPYSTDVIIKTIISARTNAPRIYPPVSD